MKVTTKKYNGADMLKLTNSAGLEVTLGSLGAGIASIKVPDRGGVQREIVKPSKMGYGGGYHGLTVGRTAGRIENATFEIDGRVAKLDANNFGKDNLHGGDKGLSTKVFKAAVDSRKDYTDVKFEYDSPDGEGGYFGNVHFIITYRVYEQANRITVLFGAVPDCKTLVNLTNHAFFNVSGDMRETIKKQTLYLGASRVGKLDERLIVREIIEVPYQFDFRTPHKIGDYILDSVVLRNTRGYDHPFFLDKHDDGTIVGSLYSEKSGIKINVRTSYPCLVLYGDNEDGYKSVCLECQYHPDGIHANPECCGICTPEKPYSEFTDFEFKTV